MKLERSKVEYPLWRKKVDKSLFEHKGTTVPLWACKMWSLPLYFQHVTSKKDPDSQVAIRYEGKVYKGWVTVAKQGRSSPAYRLWFEDGLAHELKYTFLMSYMRSLEQSLTTGKNDNIEAEIPFWEFLDIEFNKKKREFLFVAYYKQEASFPNLFERLISSPVINKIADELEDKKEDRIYKQNWKKREELEYEIGALNVIYMLLDTKNKLLYVGEAQDLIRRLSQSYPTIKDWDYFRYSVLPDRFAPYRVVLERMLIRDFASLLRNKKDVKCISISDYSLANDKIDT
jgi:hypothetical protein